MISRNGLIFGGIFLIIIAIASLIVNSVYADSTATHNATLRIDVDGVRPPSLIGGGYTVGETIEARIHGERPTNYVEIEYWWTIAGDSVLGNNDTYRLFETEDNTYTIQTEDVGNTIYALVVFRDADGNEMPPVIFSKKAYLQPLVSNTHDNFNVTLNDTNGCIDNANTSPPMNNDKATKALQDARIDDSLNVVCRRLAGKDREVIEYIYIVSTNVFEVGNRVNLEMNDYISCGLGSLNREGDIEVTNTAKAFNIRSASGTMLKSSFLKSKDVMMARINLGNDTSEDWFNYYRVGEYSCGSKSFDTDGDGIADKTVPKKGQIYMLDRHYTGL